MLALSSLADWKWQLNQGEENAFWDPAIKYLSRDKNKDTTKMSIYFEHWTQDVNWTYIRRSEDVQDVLHLFSLCPVSFLMALKSYSSSGKWTHLRSIFPSFRIESVDSLCIYWFIWWKCWPYMGQNDHS